MSALDLPALYQHPSAQMLLDALAALALQPSTFSDSGSRHPASRSGNAGSGDMKSRSGSHRGRISSNSASNIGQSTRSSSSSSSSSQSLSSTPPLHSSTSASSSSSMSSAATSAHRSAEVGIARYLTSIISSPLPWLSNVDKTATSTTNSAAHTDADDVREQIWNAASARLSERSGRNALPTLTRTFHFSAPLPYSGESGYRGNEESKTKSRDANAKDIDSDQDLAITLREPSLTADNLGHKTWAAGYLLAKRLPLLARHVPGFAIAPAVMATAPKGAAQEPTMSLSSSLQPSQPTSPRILELGAGTGLVGITAAARFSGTIHLTDLEAIVPNLEHNWGINAHLINKTHTTVLAFPLDWEDLPPRPEAHGNRGNRGEEVEDRYDVILAADTLYSPAHPRLLVAAADRFLRRSPAARVVIEAPLREAYRPEMVDFRHRMAEMGLEVLVEGEEIGLDDWEDGTMEVKCWWAVWKWADGVGVVEERR